MTSDDVGTRASVACDDQQSLLTVNSNDDTPTEYN